MNQPADISCVTLKMNYFAVQPPPPLGRFVESIFHLSDYQPESAIERVVPDTSASLVIELDCQDRWVGDNETHEPMQHCRRSWVSGPQRHYFSISALKNTELLAVRFRVGGLYPLLQSGVNSVTDRVVDAEQWFGKKVTSLRSAILALDTSEQKTTAAANWLIEYMDFGLAPPPDIQNAIDAIVEDPSNGTLTKCIERTKYSQKHMIDLFHRHVGLRPRDLQRILRFTKTLALIQGGEKVAWLALSAECGYTDQSHLIRDFKRFSGFTPTVFQATQTDRRNFIPINLEDR